MDEKHKLNAPDEEELSGVEQLQDRSDLSSVYRNPTRTFTGKVLTVEERNQAKADELEALTSGLGKHSLKIGLAVPYPFIAGVLLTVGSYLLVGKVHDILFGGITILGALAWLLTSYTAYSYIYKTFYKHALRAGPFLLVMLLSLFLASQAIYGFVTQVVSSDTLFVTVGLISLLVIVYSCLTTFVLLGIWGNSRLSSYIKVVVSCLIMAISAFLVAGVYLF